jgi:hypothetical protein
MKINFIVFANNQKMNKKGFIIIWDWRFFLIVGLIFGGFWLYDYSVNNGIIGDWSDEDLIDYKINPTNINLNYGNGKINFVGYSGLNNYFAELDRSIYYYSVEPTTKDFILKEMNNDLQYQALLPLVWEIRNKSKIQKNEANLAINLVQRIPYDYTSFYSEDLIGRYPYQVLYDDTGVCGEKSLLLAFLLKELGYGVAIFEFEVENHRAVGILCDKGNYNTNYCFVESTEPTQVGFIPREYVGSVNIQNAIPEIIFISDGRKYGE